MAEEKQFWKKGEQAINKADGYVLQADLLAHDQRYEDAVRYYDKALEIVPGNADVWAFKGITLQGGLGKDEEAMKCWDRARQLDQDLARAVDMRKDESPAAVIESIRWDELHDSCRDKLKRLMIRDAQSGSR
jgi:tetratricopeptide (TPR) repeat protein